MEDEIENAEVLLQSSNVDFVCSDRNNNLSNVGGVADDIAFIMQNTALHDNEPVRVLNIEPSEGDSSDTSDFEASSDVEIVEASTKQKVTICISTDEEEEAIPPKQNKNSKDKKINKKQQDSESKNCAVDGDEEPEDIEVICKILMKHLVRTVAKNGNKDCESDSDDSEDEIEELTEQDRMNFASILNSEEKVPNYVPKVQNEVLPEELDEEEEIIELKPDDTLVPMGLLSNVVEKMIVVEASKDAPALDAETALFTEDKTFLGKVFDTFGPVKTPFYSIRLSGHVDKNKLSRGTRVCFVPFNQNITKYIFVEQLKNLKGSDASWKNDCEPPPHHIDYSDDEEERRAKRTESNRKRQLAQDTDEAPNLQENKRNSNKAPKQRQRKMKAIDLTKHGNPLLEHARLMNDPKVNKADALTRIEPSPQDVPLSNVMPVEITDYDNSEMLRESRLEYISPLHQSNPKPNWKNQRGGGRGGHGGGRPGQGNSFTPGGYQQGNSGSNQNQGNQFSHFSGQNQSQPPQNGQYIQNYQQQQQIDGQCNQTMPVQNYNGYNNAPQYVQPPPPQSFQGYPPQGISYPNASSQPSFGSNHNPYFNSFVDVSSNNNGQYRQPTQTQYNQPSFPPNQPQGDQYAHIPPPINQQQQYDGYQDNSSGQQQPNNGYSEGNFKDNPQYQNGAAFTQNFDNSNQARPNFNNQARPNFNNQTRPNFNNQARPNFNNQNNGHQSFDSQNVKTRPNLNNQSNGPQNPNFNNRMNVPARPNLYNNRPRQQFDNYKNNINQNINTPQKSNFNQAQSFQYQQQNFNNNQTNNLNQGPQPPFPNVPQQNVRLFQKNQYQPPLPSNQIPPFQPEGIRNSRPSQNNNGAGF